MATATPRQDAAPRPTRRGILRNDYIVVDEEDEHPIHAEHRRRRAAKHIRWGAIMFGIGLGVTLVSFVQAGAGDSFIVATGAMVVGAGRFFYGLDNRR